MPDPGQDSIHCQKWYDAGNDAGNDDFDFPGNNYLPKVPAESQLMAGGLELSQQDAARSVSSPKVTNAG